MRVIVTGGGGFLGSHLVDKLIGLGHEVMVIDSFVTGNRDNLMQARKSDLWRGMITDDIIELESSWWITKSWPDSKKVDVIFNFACPASPPRYQADPIHTMMTCVIGTRNVLEWAREFGSVVIHASTSEIYGDPEVHPQVESYKGCVNTLGPRACYDEGKRAAETLLMDYNRKHNVPVKMGRIFNTYGPRMDPNDGRVVSNFICQAIRGEDITIYGDGSQTRSFCYVDDLIDGFIRLMNTPPEFTGPVNLGNPNEFTMNELANHVLKLVHNADSRISLRPLPQDDPRQRKPDITLAKNVLGWEPKVNLVEGLKKTIDYFESVL